MDSRLTLLEALEELDNQKEEKKPVDEGWDELAWVNSHDFDDGIGEYEETEEDEFDDIDFDSLAANVKEDEELSGLIDTDDAHKKIIDNWGSAEDDEKYASYIDNDNNRWEYQSGRFTPDRDYSEFGEELSKSHCSGNGLCIKSSGLTEGVEDTIPVDFLLRDEVYDAIENVIRSGATFKIGYFKELKPSDIASEFRGGRKAVAGNPIVRIFKATEADGQIGFDYENLKDVKELRASGVERQGNRYEVEQELGNKIMKAIGTGNSLIQFHPQQAGLSSKYFISFDGSDLEEISKADVKQYCIPSLFKNDGAEWDPTRVMRFNVNNVFWIKSKDFEIGSPLWQMNYK